jgi:hypothetical protein
MKESGVAIMYKTAVLIVIGLAPWGLDYADATVIDFYDDGVIEDGDDYLKVSVYGTAMVDMGGGSVWTLALNDSSIVNIYDGWVDALFAGDSSTVNLFGGVIDLYVQATEFSRVYIYGYGFEVTPSGLKGYWLDGTEFDMRLRRTHLPDPHYVLVPEPGTLLLLSLSGLLFVHRRRVQGGQ